MKKILFTSLSLFLSLTCSVSHAQVCIREVTAFMAAPGGFDISGTAVLESSDAIILQIDSTFGTQSGPDLHVYLAANFEAPSTPGNNNVDLGQLSSNMGAQSFPVPSGVSIGDYDYVLIHCKSFNHWWGGGVLGEISCTSATATPVDEILVSMYPNPSASFVTVACTNPDVTKIIVMDMLGRIRSTHSLSNPESMSIDVSDLEHGVFLMFGMDERGKTIFRKSLEH